jgi:ribonuclease P protein component
MRFPRNQKLGQAAQFERLRDEGRRLDTGAYLVWFRIRPPDEEPTLADARRFAINASRRVGSAVVRNRLKRVLREAFRLGQEQLPARCDVWVQLKNSAAGMRHEELGRRLLEAAARFARQGNRPPRSPKPPPAGSTTAHDSPDAPEG